MNRTTYFIAAILFGVAVCESDAMEKQSWLIRLIVSVISGILWPAFLVCRLSRYL